MVGVYNKVEEEVSLFTLTPNSSHFPQMLVSEKFNNVHPLVGTFFPLGLRNCPLAVRLSHFITNWEILTKDQNILDIVAGYKIPFLSQPIQKKTPKPSQWNQQQQYLIHQEIEQLPEKGAIRRARTEESQYLSSIFLVPKKAGGNSPVIDWKGLILTFLISTSRWNVCTF